MEKEKTASLDVDAQQGFTPLCPKEFPVLDGDKIVDELNSQAEFAKFRIFSKDWHNRNALWIANSNHPQYEKLDLPNADIRWNEHCIGGTKGAELIHGLPKIDDYDFGVYKGMEKNMHPYGACYQDLGNKVSTGLIEWLRYNKIENVIVGGLALEYSVKSTVMQLIDSNFKVILNVSATKGIDPHGLKDTINEMKIAGAIIIKDFSYLKNILI